MDEDIEFNKVNYNDLNARQKETYNFQKVSGVLADYGFVTLLLSDDWQGADFLAYHNDGETTLKIQLKSRLTFGKKYLGRGLWVAFPHNGHWYLYPHDSTFKTVSETLGIITDTRSWTDKGLYHFGKLSDKLLNLMEPYRLG